MPGRLLAQLCYCAPRQAAGGSCSWNKQSKLIALNTSNCARPDAMMSIMIIKASGLTQL